MNISDISGIIFLQDDTIIHHRTIASFRMKNTRLNSVHPIDLFKLISILLSRKMNDLCEASAIANRNKEGTHNRHRKKSYTTITTSRRNKNSENVSMCECTNENNKKQIVVLFFSNDEKEKSK